MHKIIATFITQINQSSDFGPRVQKSVCILFIKFIYYKQFLKFTTFYFFCLWNLLLQKLRENWTYFLLRESMFVSDLDYKVFFFVGKLFSFFVFDHRVELYFTFLCNKIFQIQKNRQKWIQHFWWFSFYSLVLLIAIMMTMIGMTSHTITHTITHTIIIGAIIHTITQVL